MLLIVMYEAGTWRATPGQALTFGRGEGCTITLPAAERIGWSPHAVAKRCENLRDRYSRLGVPGLRGPRALEELAAVLISTEELTAEDLKRLPDNARIR